MSELVDKHIVCAECGTTFTWDVEEQKYYQKKGFKNEPTKCRACRARKKIEQELEKAKEKNIACSICGKKGVITTDLDEDEELFCLDCHVKEMTKEAASSSNTAQ